MEPRGPWARACGVAMVTTDLRSPLERPQLLPPRVQILLCVLANVEPGAREEGLGENDQEESMPWCWR